MQDSTRNWKNSEVLPTTVLVKQNKISNNRLLFLYLDIFCCILLNTRVIKNKYSIIGKEVRNMILSISNMGTWGCNPLSNRKI